MQWKEFWPVVSLSVASQILETQRDENDFESVKSYYIKVEIVWLIIEFYLFYISELLSLKLSKFLSVLFFKWQKQSLFKFPHKNQRHVAVRYLLLD